ncbi:MULTISPECIES: sodium:solute symporter [unclassified Saccharopolyspora]|uniref:sodium:solute symporter family protein n=1 Tax=unclassified Saccharopolyspora TaxID=2646250 RepID=UPI001CD6683F|nr:MULTISPECIES: sodium:solute symporter family protein [unclassified Saccharopolyspora]MCA1189453.1 sodium:solute symporter family protein [Saccharopolyspora sp. 6T]MCA1282740.1 sodium:solute symporter family protein [Saccharopolyspora sp. 7B]
MATALLGLVLIAVVGLLGRRGGGFDLAAWTVGGRRFGAVATFFLQAGEIFTTFTFLGISGLVLGGGVAAMYMPSYLVLGYVGMFLVAPLVWRLGKRHGYRTNSDYLRHRFRSPVLGGLTAVLAIVFFMPVIQVQLVGLGTIVSFMTGDERTGTASVVVAMLLVLLFVLWSGLHGVAATSYLKDVLMVVALLVIAGGVLLARQPEDGLFTAVFRGARELLTIQPAGSYGTAWYVSSILVSAAGFGAMTLPSSWPAVLSGRSSKAVASNHVFLPLYTVAVAIPVLVGFYAVADATTPAGAENAALLELAQRTLPAPLLAVVLIGGAACAMVPAAGGLICVATLVSSNLVPSGMAEGARLRASRITAAVVSVLVLALTLGRPDLMANLYLLTYSGMIQLAPANLLALREPVPVRSSAVLAGLVAGECVVLVSAVLQVNPFGVNSGLTGLAVNLLVLGVAAAVRRRSPAPPEPAPIG